MMSDPTSIFNNDNNGAPPQNDGNSNPNAQPDAKLTDLLMSIKNERGEPKYKSVEDALIGLQHAQTYIPQLKDSLTAREQELEKARKEAERVAELEETVRKLTEQPSNNGSPPKVPTAQELAGLIEQTLTKREQEALAKKNIESVVSSMKTAFGTEAEKKFVEKAQELGMTIQEFNALAARSPKLVLDTVGVKQAPASFAPPASTVNSSAFKQNEDTFIGRNKDVALVGATTHQLQDESRKAKKMVEELHAQGKSVHDLSDPKVFFNTFR